jgi:hypothetical protein
MTSIDAREAASALSDIDSIARRLTTFGYFFVEGAAFVLWMALVCGGGLVRGGLWMRRN